MITLKTADHERPDLFCSFYHDPLRAQITMNINNFAITSHMTFKSNNEALRNYLEPTCQYERSHTLPNRKITFVEDHGKNYIKVRLLLVRHRNR